MGQKTLYKFTLDCGRNGDLSGVFVSTQEQIEKSLGKYADFGEALGKHSDVGADLKLEMLTVLSEDPEKVEWFEQVVGSVGYNPLDYIYGED